LRIEVPHNTTPDKARKIVEQKMKALQSQYGHYANDIDHQWQGDTLHFSFKAKGFTGKGTLEITDSSAIIDGKLPLLAKPFESRIRSTVEREAEEMFRA
jgi:hypothetical protein